MMCFEMTGGCIIFGITSWFVHTTDDVHVQGRLKWYNLTSSGSMEDKCMI